MKNLKIVSTTTDSERFLSNQVYLNTLVNTERSGLKVFIDTVNFPKGRERNMFYHLVTSQLSQSDFKNVFVSRGLTKFFSIRSKSNKSLSACFPGAFGTWMTEETDEICALYSQKEIFDKYKSAFNFVLDIASDIDEGSFYEPDGLWWEFLTLVNLFAQGMFISYSTKEFSEGFNIFLMGTSYSKLLTLKNICEEALKIEVEPLEHLTRLKVLASYERQKMLPYLNTGIREVISCLSMHLRSFLAVGQTFLPENILPNVVFEYTTGIQTSVASHDHNSWGFGRQRTFMCDFHHFHTQLVSFANLNPCDDEGNDVNFMIHTSNLLVADSVLFDQCQEK